VVVPHPRKLLSVARPRSSRRSVGWVCGMVSRAQAKMCSGSGKEINVMNDQSPILDRLDNQIDWYDRKSQSAQKRYKLL
jgi:hypothetical protein